MQEMREISHGSGVELQTLIDQLARLAAEEKKIKEAIRDIIKGRVGRI